MSAMLSHWLGVSHGKCDFSTNAVIKFQSMAMGTVRDLSDVFSLPPHSCLARVAEILMKVELEKNLQSF